MASMKIIKMKDRETGIIYIVEIHEEFATVIGGGDKPISNAITAETRTTYTFSQLNEKFVDLE